MKSLFLVAAFLPGGFVVLVALGLMVFVTVLYALYKKGEVRVMLARGKTSFELVAKEKSPASLRLSEKESQF